MCQSNFDFGVTSGLHEKLHKLDISNPYSTTHKIFQKLEMSPLNTLMKGPLNVSQNAQNASDDISKPSAFGGL